MVSIERVFQYDHALTAKFVFSFGKIELSAVFWEDVVHVLLPDDKDTLWKVVKEEKELFEFLKTLAPENCPEIRVLQFVIRYGKSDLTRGVRTKGKTGLDWENATHELIRQQPSTQTPSPYVLPFGSR